MMSIDFLSEAIFPLQALLPVVTSVTRVEPLTYDIGGLRGNNEVSSFAIQ